MSKKFSLICIICGLIFLGIGVYLNFSLSDENEKDPVVEKDPVSEQKESLDINGDLAQGLYYMTKSSWSRANNLIGVYHYKSDKVLTSNFEIAHLYEIVFSRLNRKGLIDNGVVSEDNVKNEFKEIFGNYVEYHSIDSFNLGCDFVTYDSINKNYKVIYTNCVAASSISTKILSAYRYSDKVVIEEKVLFIKDGVTYYDPDFLEVANVSIDDEDEKILVYKYTFMYDKNNDLYYFYSIEK